MEKIMQSKDYDMFELMEFNRDVKKTKYLEKSMAEHGFIDAYPLHTIKNGNRKFKIKAGHHRYFVARKLGLPVKFVVCNDNASIHQLEKSTTQWSLKDYLDSYCRCGKQDYLRVKEYCDETNISLSQAISMLGGQSASGGSNFNQMFKDGRFKIREESLHARNVASIVSLMKQNGVNCFKTPNLISAISKTLFVKEFKIERFKQKISQFPGLIDKKANLDQYLDLVEMLYNHKSQQKIPLKFLANEEAGRRKAFGLKSEC